MVDEADKNVVTLRAFINYYSPSKSSFRKSQGAHRQLFLEGYVDDPYQSPMGDIDEYMPNSRFSRAPVEVHLRFFDKKGDETRFGADSIGVLAAKKDIKVETFELLGAEHIIPPVKAWIDLPLETLASIEDTARDCAKDNKLAVLELELTVNESQLNGEDSDRESAYWHPRLKDLDVSEALEIAVTEVRFAKTIIEKSAPETRVKRLESDDVVSSFQIALKGSTWVYDPRNGEYSKLKVKGVGTAGKRLVKQEIKVDIDFKNFYRMNDDYKAISSLKQLPEKNSYGRYSFLNEDKYLSLTLGFHDEHFEEVIKPKLLQSPIEDIWIRIWYFGSLDFTENKSGKIYDYSFIASNKTQNIVETSHVKALEEKLEDVVKELKFMQRNQTQLESDIHEELSALRSLATQAAEDRVAIYHKVSEPNDLVARILLKIPIVGSIVRLISK